MIASCSFVLIIMSVCRFWTSFSRMRKPQVKLLIVISPQTLFFHIRDKVWKKLQHWKGTLFSAGGKKVMLKAVIQAMPTYSMTLFRLPQSLIYDLHRLMARFWWESNASNNKIHWCSWSHLCRSKLESGLGFRDLSLFNQALLAKSLCPISAVWRSILWGRSLLEKGLRWRIGGGKAVSIYDDNWISRPFFFKARPSFLLPHDAQVSLLKGASGDWDTKLVRDSFSLEDAEYILFIPPSSCEDAPCWHFDKLGKFSVKSAHWLASQNPDLASSSSSAPLASWWRSFWLLNFFLWRLCHDWLPSAGSLVRKHISMAEHCHLCI
ncbi:hypothetical protein ACOSQ3_001829 [Xanthoceras sorbifolium]